MRSFPWCSPWTINLVWQDWPCAPSLCPKHFMLSLLACSRLLLQVLAIFLQLLTPVLLTTSFLTSPNSSLTNLFGIYRSEWVPSPSSRSWVVAQPSYLLTASKLLSGMRLTYLVSWSHFTAYGLIFSNGVMAFLELEKLVWWCTSLLLCSRSTYSQIVIWPMILWAALKRYMTKTIILCICYCLTVIPFGELCHWLIVRRFLFRLLYIFNSNNGLHKSCNFGSGIDWHCLDENE